MSDRVIFDVGINQSGTHLTGFNFNYNIYNSQAPRNFQIKVEKSNGVAPWSVVHTENSRAFNTNVGWHTATIDFRTGSGNLLDADLANSTAGDKYRVSILGYNSTNNGTGISNRTIAFDNVNIEAIHAPEPTSALLGVLTFGIFVMRRRR